MLDISVCASKVNGWPKGRTNSRIKKGSEQILYPEKVALSHIIYNIRKHEGLIYRKACGGFEIRGKQRFEPDMWK